MHAYPFMNTIPIKTKKLSIKMDMSSQLLKKKKKKKNATWEVVAVAPFLMNVY